MAVTTLDLTTLAVQTPAVNTLVLKPSMAVIGGDGLGRELLSNGPWRLSAILPLSRRPLFRPTRAAAH